MCPALSPFTRSPQRLYREGDPAPSFVICPVFVHSLLVCIRVRLRTFTGQQWNVDPTGLAPPLSLIPSAAICLRGYFAQPLQELAGWVPGFIRRRRFLSFPAYKNACISPAASRTITNSGPVQSITVDGILLPAPPSITRSTWCLKSS